MTYKVLFSRRAMKDLKKLDPTTVRFIMAWVRKNLEGCTNPRQHGKGLTANHSGKWRYRIGDYRLLAEISDHDLIILVLSTGHRRDIYT